MTIPVVVIIVLAVLVILLAYALGLYLRRRGERPSPPRLPTSSPSALAGDDRETRAVVGWLINQAFEQTGVKVADDKMAYDRILNAARKAVDELKTQDAVTISLPFLTADAAGPKHVEARLTRQAIQELVRY
jgi:molecular chaperone DnaK